VGTPGQAGEKPVLDHAGSVGGGGVRGCAGTREWCQHEHASKSGAQACALEEAEFHRSRGEAVVAGVWQRAGENWFMRPRWFWKATCEPEGWRGKQTVPGQGR